MDATCTPRIVGSLIIGLSTTYIAANGLMLVVFFGTLVKNFRGQELSKERTKILTKYGTRH